MGSTTERGLSLVGSLGSSCMKVQEIFVLRWLLYNTIQYNTKYFFLTEHFFKFMCSHRPASWAGSHAGSPVSWYVPSTVLEAVIQLLA